VQSETQITGEKVVIRHYRASIKRAKKAMITSDECDDDVDVVKKALTTNTAWTGHQIISPAVHCIFLQMPPSGKSIKLLLSLQSRRDN